MRRAIVSPQVQAVGLQCLACPTRRSAEWGVLRDRDMQALSAAKSSRTYRKGEMVYAQDQACPGLFCIASGTAAVARTEPRLPTVLVRMAQSGETFGYGNVVRGGMCDTSAKVLEPSVICRIELPILATLFDQHPRLVQRFQSRLAEDLARTESALAQLAWLPVRSRLARLIMSLAEYRGTANGRGVLSLTLPMTRRDMADLLCTRPETLTRTMQAMESDGIVRCNGHQVDIPDPERLHEAAQAQHLG